MSLEEREGSSAQRPRDRGRPRPSPRRLQCRHQGSQGGGERGVHACCSSRVAHIQEQLCRNRSTDTERAKPRRRTVHPETGHRHARPPASPREAPGPGRSGGCGQTARGVASEGLGRGQLSHAYTRRGNPGLLSTGCHQEASGLLWAD